MSNPTHRNLAIAAPVMVVVVVVVVVVVMTAASTEAAMKMADIWCISDKSHAMFTPTLLLEITGGVLPLTSLLALCPDSPSAAARWSHIPGPAATRQAMRTQIALQALKQRQKANRAKNN
jgi:hypothetical protein